MKHEGEILKKMIEENDVSRAKFSERAGFTVSYLYKLYDRPVVKNVYKKIAAKLAEVDVRDYFPDMPIEREEEHDFSKQIENLQEIASLQQRLLEQYQVNQKLQAEMLVLKEEATLYRAKYAPTTSENKH